MSIEMIQALDEKIESLHDRRPAPSRLSASPPALWEFSLDRARALRLVLASVVLAVLVWAFGFLMGLIWNPHLPAVQATQPAAAKPSSAQPPPVQPVKASAPSPRPAPAPPAQQPAPQQAAAQPEAAQGPYCFQVGAFNTAEGAQRMIGQLEEKGYEPYLHVVDSSTLPRYRVRIGRFVSQEEAREAARSFESQEGTKVLLRRN